MSKFILNVFSLKSIIFLAGAIYMSTINAENDFSSYKKPNFTIEFSAIQLGFEIRLNDIPVFDIDDSGFMTLEVSANEYIINGNNSLKVITYPPFDDNDEQNDNYIDGAKIEVALYIREDTEDSKMRKLISKVAISPNNAYNGSNPVATYLFGDKSSNPEISFIKDANILNYPEYGNFKKQVSTLWEVINIKSSLPRWEWQDGLIITNTKVLYESLLGSYQNLYNALEAKDIELVKKISEKRSKELSMAYYLDDTNEGFEYSALGKDINSTEIKLYDKLYIEGTKFEILANGKLARITSGDHVQPILYVNYETEQLYQHQFKWYLNQNNEWVLIR